MNCCVWRLLGRLSGCSTDGDQKTITEENQVFSFAMGDFHALIPGPCPTEGTALTVRSLGVARQPVRHESHLRHSVHHLATQDANLGCNLLRSPRTPMQLPILGGVRLARSTCSESDVALVRVVLRPSIAVGMTKPDAFVGFCPPPSCGRSSYDNNVTLRCFRK